ncbi:hypothetical protein TNCV_781241 [Trichonephila clavipes]|nr:hypothetical protein TNCV_781241 [Trichonephila clavipes]
MKFVYEWFTRFRKAALYGRLATSVSDENINKDRTITNKNFYHPPNSQHLDINMMEDLFNDSTIILGDFNAKNSTRSSTITNVRGLELSNLVNNKAFLSLNEDIHTFCSSNYGATDIYKSWFISLQFLVSTGQY